MPALKKFARVLKLVTICFLVTLLFTNCKDDSVAPREPVEYPKVVVMDSTIKTSLNDETGVLIFSNLPKNNIPEVGDVIVSDITDDVPFGYLYKVKSINFVNEQWVVTTEPATLAEALPPNTQFITDFDVEPTHFIEYDDDGNPLPQKPMDQFQGSFSFSEGVKFPFNKSVKYGGFYSAEAKIGGEVELKFKNYFELNTGKWLNVEKFQITVTPEFKAKLTASIKGKVSEKCKTPLWTFYCGKIRILIPTPAGIPIPIVIVPVIDIGLQIDAEGTITLEGEIVNFTASAELGFDYSEDDYGEMSARRIFDTKIENKIGEMSLGVAGSFSIGPSADFRFRFYNSPGCYVGVDASIPTKLEAKIDLNPNVIYGNESLNPKLTLSTQADLQLAAALTILGKKIFYLQDHIKVTASTPKKNGGR